MIIVQWNKPDSEEKVLLARDCKDCDKVRLTNYNEIYNILGTNGCSKEEPYWDWSVLGIIDTPKGKIVVSPGDFIIEEFGEYRVLNEKSFNNIFNLNSNTIDLIMNNLNKLVEIVYRIDPIPRPTVKQMEVINFIEENTSHKFDRFSSYREDATNFIKKYIQESKECNKKSL